MRDEGRFLAHLRRLPTPTYLFRRAEADFELVEYNGVSESLVPELAATAVGQRASALLEDRPALLEDLARCWREQQPVQRTTTTRVSGVLRTTHLTYVPIPPDVVVLHAQDVTAGEVTQAALDRSEEKYRTLVESSLQGITIYQGGRIVFANRAAAELAGRSIDELLGLRPEDQLPLVHPDDRAWLVQWIEDLRQRRPAPTRSQYRTLRGDGSVCWIESMVGPVDYGGLPALMVVAVDVTERRQAEQALRASEERYRAIVETEPQCVKVLAKDGTLVDMNAAGLRMIEANSLEQVRGRDMTQMVAPLHRQAFRELLRRVMAGGGGTLQFETVGLKGARRWLETHAVPLRDSDGRVTGLLGITADISERKRAEDELRDSESRYRSLVHGALYGIYRSTVDGRLLEANPALVSMLGYQSEAELLSVDWASGVYQDPEGRARLVGEHRDADRIEGVEVGWKRKDSTPITVRLSGRAVRDQFGALTEFEMIVEDVTARRALEEQFRQAQKMEAIGQLAGGVAHDFNNLLTAILGSADLLLLDLPPEDPRREDLLAIRDAGERAAGLTRQLLAFSRRQVLQPRVIDLNDVLAGMETLLPRIIGEDIRLETVPGPDLDRVCADPSQIEQVILNLAVNARDAMPDGGRLTIETANAVLDPAFTVRHPLLLPGRYVRLSVSDTGYGMDEVTQARIFEPFFTTKGPGKGTGLGLATVYGIVKQSGGYIWVRSEPGSGTTFDVYLLPVDRPADGPSNLAAQPEAQAGSETILLVEDDLAVRALARRALERYGYRVLEATNGRQALEAMRGDRHTIDLLLTDIVMPEMGGRRSAEQVLLLRPDLKVLYMSGYAGPEHPAEPGALVQKPFTPESLARKVREVLDG